MTIPDHVTYLGQSLLNVDVRPVRAAYIVRASSVSDFRRAVFHASSRWGGMQEPIIPISIRGAVVHEGFRQALDLLDPEVVVNVARLSDSALDRAQRLLGRTFWPDQNFEALGDGLNQLGAATAADLNRMIVEQAASTLARDAALGILGPPEEHEEWTRLGVRLVAEDDEARLALAQMDGRTVLGLTVSQCQDTEVQGGGVSPAIVWISRGASLRDATRFWNLRALAPRVGLVAPVILTTPEAAQDPRVRENLHNYILANRFASSRPDVVCVSDSVTDEALHEVGRSLGLTLYEEETIGSSLHSRPRDLAERPLTYLTGATVDPRHWFVGTRRPGRQTNTLAQLTQPQTTVRVESPVSFNLGIPGQVRVRLSGPRALALPPRKPIAELFHASWVWKHGGLEFMTNPTPSLWLEFQLPSLPQALTAALAERQVTASLSAPGGYATGVANLTGGAEPFGSIAILDVVRALTTPRLAAVTRQLQDLQPHASTDEVKAMALELGGRLPQRVSTFEEIRGRVPVVARSSASETLQLLVERKAVHRGFRTRCDVCNMANFVDVGVARPRPKCPSCGAPVALQVQPATGEPQFSYRLNALVDRASDQGALGHLFAMRLLEASEPGLYLMPGANLHSAQGQHLGEVDLLGISAADVIAGEVKSSARDFTDDQIAHHLELSAAVGADRHIMVCLEPIQQDVQDHAMEMCAQAGMRLTTLSPDSGG